MFHSVSVQGPLIAGLKSIEEYSLVTISVAVVGDLCRALKKDILPFCDDIMRLLLELLQSQTLNRFVSLKESYTRSKNYMLLQIIDL